MRTPNDQENPESEIRKPRARISPSSCLSTVVNLGLHHLNLFRHSSFVILPSLSLLLAVPLPATRAQPMVAPPQDALMSLMLSQPKIDIWSPVTATAAFDPPVVRPGESSMYRVTFNALEASIEWPAKLTAPPQLEMIPGAHGEMLRMTGFSYAPLTAFNCRVRSASPGQFSVPEFTVNVYGKRVTVPAARLEVVSVPLLPAQPAPQVLLDVPATNLFVGQAVRARVLLPAAAGGGVQGLGQVQLTGQGILVDLGGVRQRIDTLPYHGTRVPTFVYETTLTPMVTGKLRVFAQGFAATGRFTGPVMITGTLTIPGGLPQYTLLESEPIELEVRSLPPEGELPGFAGAIGNLALGPTKLGTNVVRVGDMVKLTVTVTNRGNGPLARLVAPPAPQVRDWQVFPPTEVAPAQPVSSAPPGAPAQADLLEGVTTFNYTLIPLTAEARATPSIPFSYFDPMRRAYVDLTIPSLPVSVKAGETPGDLQALLQPDSPAAETEKEPVLSGLAASPGRMARSLVPAQQQAWFPLLQLALAAAFIGLWGWDRRRRYFEQHPDVLLRRRARRDLRRKRRALRQAAQAKDAPGFAAAAVSAMRVACAPHYPAEPRALVGSDVLALLRETGGNARASEVVRRFFAVTDASRFAAAGGDAAELLALEPDLEHLLQQLEERL